MSLNKQTFYLFKQFIMIRTGATYSLICKKEVSVKEIENRRCILSFTRLVMFVIEPCYAYPSVSFAELIKILLILSIRMHRRPFLTVSDNI